MLLVEDLAGDDANGALELGSQLTTSKTLERKTENSENFVSPDYIHCG